MPLKLDHDIIIDSRGREYIKNFKYSLCTVDDIKRLSKILLTIDLYPALDATVNKFSDLINKFY